MKMQRSLGCNTIVGRRAASLALLAVWSSSVEVCEGVLKALQRSDRIVDVLET
ncbi:unnamed protein product [Amoebophrya sp. A120]|nr:unnamed protein product [Amoebophrya sp. A120]|eukprot:GSA120T00010592001.1